MEVPRAKYPKLGVFLHPEVLKKVEKRAKAEKVSMTRFVETLVMDAVGDSVGHGRRKAS